MKTVRNNNSKLWVRQKDAGKLRNIKAIRTSTEGLKHKDRKKAFRNKT